MTAKLYSFGDHPSVDDRFAFLETQVRYLLILWDKVLDRSLPVLNTAALTELACVAGVAPMPRDHETLMLSLQDVWYVALKRPHAQGYKGWKAAVQGGRTAEAQRWLKVLALDHGSTAAETSPRLGVVLPMTMH